MFSVFEVIKPAEVADYDESYHTNLSTTISEKTSDHVGRCILVSLIFAIFIFGIIVAFVVGHWIAQPEVHFEDSVNNFFLFFLHYYHVFSSYN